MSETHLAKSSTIEISTISSVSSSICSSSLKSTSLSTISGNMTAPANVNSIPPAVATTATSTSWLLRFFESKHFDMSIAISYLFNTKEPGVQTYLCNRLFTFTNKDVDFYLPQLLNIYIYCCNDNNEQLIADMLNAYFRSRCSCRQTGIDFSIRCSWLLDAHINDNAKLATKTKESKKVRRGLNNAIKLYRLIINERLRPLAAANTNDTSHNTNKSKTNDVNEKINSNSNATKTIMTSLVKEESLNEIADNSNTGCCNFNSSSSSNGGNSSSVTNNEG